MIWLKIKITIPKLVVTIYRLSFLWLLPKRTVHFFYRSDNFALPFFHPMSLSMIVPAAWSLDLARRHQFCIKHLVSFVYEFRPLNFMSCRYTS